MYFLPHILLLFYSNYFQKMDKFGEFWNGPGGVVVLVVILLLLVVFIIWLSALTHEVNKKASFVPYGNHGGNDNLKNGGDSDQPGYSLHVPGAGVSALLCGGKGSAASKLSGAALEANLLGAMDDYMSASDIALDKSIGSIYTAGTGSSS